MKDYYEPRKKGGAGSSACVKKIGMNQYCSTHLKSLLKLLLNQLCSAEYYLKICIIVLGLFKIFSTPEAINAEY